MLKIVTGLALAIGWAAAAPAAFAQDGPARAPSPRSPRSFRIPPVEKTLAQQLIHRRAAFLARQRTARIELRKWLGISLLRPNLGYIPPSPWDLPWDGYYRSIRIYVPN